MRNNKLAFYLALIAGVLCLGSFIYKLVKTGTADYIILVAGVFIVAIGFSQNRRNDKK